MADLLIVREPSDVDRTRQLHDACAKSWLFRLWLNSFGLFHEQMFLQTEMYFTLRNQLRVFGTFWAVALRPNLVRQYKIVCAEWIEAENHAHRITFWPSPFHMLSTSFFYRTAERTGKMERREWLTGRREQYLSRVLHYEVDGERSVEGGVGTGGKVFAI